MDHNNTLEKGRWAEALALEYLKKSKLKLLNRNYRSSNGEIDLIMQDGKQLVFIEVRSRASNNLASPAETIDNKKRSRIIRTSQCYLMENREIRWDTCRFDVVTITGDRKRNDIQWIKNAFEA